MRRCPFPWGQTFFGLQPSDRENFLESVFLLMYYGGFTYSECYKLPTQYRTWFIDRINREFKKAAGKDTAQTRAAHQNDPSSRSTRGMSRQTGPSRTRRFT